MGKHQKTQKKLANSPFKKTRKTQSQIVINTWENINLHMKNVINTWENIKTHQKITQMGPKVAPISTLGRPRGPPVIDLVFGHPFFMIFGDFWGRFWLPFGSSFGVNF